MKHARYILCLIMLLAVARLSAQELSVTNFKLLANDLTANISGTMQKDQNGETAALIKVQTTQTGFIFDGGSLGIVKTEQKVGEIWVYVPKGAKRITIQHPQLGVLRDYTYPVTIESGRTYEMDLITGTVQTTVRASVGGQYCVFTLEPKNASIFIDDNEQTASDGILSILLPYGDHQYRVLAPLYHTDAGIVTVGTEKINKTVTLSPNYGMLEINSIPVGAEVYLDGSDNCIGKTPVITDKLTPGQHQVTLKLHKYVSKTFTADVLGDGSTKSQSFTLQPNFATITVNEPAEAELYVNDQKTATGNWNGELAPGMYKLESKLKGHQSVVKTITVEPKKFIRNSQVV